MQKLIQGLHHFQTHIFGTQRQLFERLAEGQAPETLFITCSDSRINPNLVTQTQPGELFILRNAGNIIPPAEIAGSGEAATLEFAVRVLGVRDIIVCGHSHCGAMQALLAPKKLADLPHTRAWLGHAEATRLTVEENYRHLEGDALLTAATQENVLQQLEHLRGHPAVAEALEAGRLNLHGWMYRFETGRVFVYHPEDGQFVPLMAEAGEPA